ncbi:tRNA isopentenyltransferase [Patellaria atrata CBS 101060]|uniref:tRNA dimethylallyltransferase n=1 Tax=Patellaria atrata CBS 101060 TaxID=1346257 RepID=A0A9P4S952_9PEZI|nr:tRNA isopentenyltransferase [Patellaria atrata CBS 101060]
MLPLARLFCSIRTMLRPPQRPLIAVIGATGTGKSNLAIDLAERFNGEIINGDAMQLYAGLPIITNKIPVEEQRGVKHHLLGCIGLEEETWTVQTFVNKALGVIDEIRSRGRLPILVGGSHYYTQALLFRDQLNAELSEEEYQHTIDSRKPYPILDEPTEAIWEKLNEVDPVMAARWHPKDRRKIQRSLEIWLKTGRKASEVYEEQRLRKSLNAGGPVGGAEDKLDITPMGFRFPTLLFWVYAATGALSTRLDYRIDAMLENGLLDEVRKMHEYLQEQETHGRFVDKTRGIWQSIGYKQFEDYTVALQSTNTSEKDLAKLRMSGVEQMKGATRRFSKRQARWIRIKLFNALREFDALSNLFLLDGTDIKTWNDNVQSPAFNVCSKFLKSHELPSPTSLSSAASEMLQPLKGYDLSQRQDLWERRTCEFCNTVTVTEDAWLLHIKSRPHKIRKRKAQTVDRVEIPKLEANDALARSNRSP